MGGWAGYFFAKGYLYFRGVVPFDVILNLAFVVFLILPTPEVLKRSRLAIVARWAMSAVIAVLLAWHDSWFPPLPDVVRFVADGGLPTPEFLVQFLRGFVNPWVVLVIVALFATTVAVRRSVRLTPLVLVLLLIVGLREGTQPTAGMDGVVASFVTAESKRVIEFQPIDERTADFDVVVLHVCSLSWDDLREIGMEDAPFLRDFDYVLTEFNSVTSHSTIAALRLLRSTCGQTTQEALYRRGPHECYLFDALQQLGYATSFALNHDGKYMGFQDDVRRWGHLDVPLAIEDLPVRQYDFTGGPLRADKAVLERWWNTRERSGERRAALYYNTTTLHIGGRWAGETAPQRDVRAQYTAFAQTLFKDLDEFLALLASSGRNTVVFFVPEHGAALRGTTLQPSGLREIPLPRITTVPVAVKLIGPQSNPRPRAQQVIATPTSYGAVAVFLAEFFKHSPFEPSQWAGGPPLVEVPETDFVAENEDVRVVKEGPQYFVKHRSSDVQWIKLPSDAISQNAVSVF